jgi:branched-chain amino acid transport system permease protein
MEFLLLLVINGLAVGCIYALVALGFVVIYKSSGVLNLAQGEFLLLGAYVFWAIVTEYHVPLPLALAITISFSVILGLLMERLILRPMIGEPIISVIMVTLGLSSVLRAVVLALWGTDTRAFPTSFDNEPLRLGPLAVASGSLMSLAIVTVLLVLFSLFFRFSRQGIAMRATAFSQQVALSMGISVKRIFGISWSIAAAVSVIGGVLLGALRGGIDGSLSMLGLKALPVVILGGLDSIGGAIVGGLAIGVLENLAGGYLDPVFGGGVKEVAPFVVLVLILMVKPYGLFGKVKIERV